MQPGTIISFGINNVLSYIILSLYAQNAAYYVVAGVAKQLLTTGNANNG